MYLTFLMFLTRQCKSSRCYGDAAGELYSIIGVVEDNVGTVLIIHLLY
jgi:hypothetical protein